MNRNEEFGKRTAKDPSVNNADRILELEQLLRDKERRFSELEQELEILKKAGHIFNNPRK